MIKFVKTLRSTLLVIGTLMGAASSVSAGSFDPAVMDPVVTPPAQCLIFGILPCHTGFDYHNPEGDDHVVPVGTVNDTDDDPYCDDDEGPSKGGKGNASANNGKGGNYDKTGHSDNGKGNGKGRR